MKNYELLNRLDSNIIPIDTYYNKAVIAVQECAKLDEAKEWTDKMSALAYYHKQAGDKTLENYAIRIRYRGQRRMGELLKQFDSRGSYNGNQHTGNIGKNEDNLDSSKSLSNVAASVGLSEWQTLESTRFANIPKDKFEEIIESDNIPTKSEIAKLGTKQREIKVDKSYKAVSFLGWLRDFKKACDEDDPLYLLSVMDDKQKQKTLATIKELENWFDTFVINCQQQ
jgi:hypothetical protein